MTPHQSFLVFTMATRYQLSFDTIFGDDQGSEHLNLKDRCQTRFQEKVEFSQKNDQKKSKASSKATSSSTEQASSSSTASSSSESTTAVFDGAIGIDFGNHNCTVAYFNVQHLLSSFPNLNSSSALTSSSPNKPCYAATVIQPVQNMNSHVVIIQNEDGAHHTPSVIKVNTIIEGEGTDNEKNKREIIVGFPPLPGASLAPDQVISDLKEFMLEDEERMKKENTESPERIAFNGEEYSQDYMVSLLLGKMKNIAEHYLGKKVKKAVISCPSNSSHCEAVIRKACDLLDMKVLTILKEPIAALIGYGFDLPKPNEGARKVCVIDVGALETNISIVKVAENGLFEMIKSESKRPLGGESIDQVMIQMCLQEFKRLYYKNMSESMFQQEVGKNRKVQNKLRRSCENAKIVLSNNQQAMIEIDSLYDGLDFQFKITRARFESSVMSIFASIIEHARQTADSLAEQDYSFASITDVVLVGGSCQIPKLRDSIQTLFSQAKVHDSAVEDSIAIGCAIQAHLMHMYSHLMNNKTN
ncbi:hypothetical protein FDP41_010136 [Naegleria fowleri]|uniref:Uncharacterized protein n=1 Tax=Naegleria fowleri TaxID=5763 RepID=A0A6A5AY53_NAEFO|nr:uncharacterized protein FDP41_010136 [Naegleria fowleri]KAF0971607.1 hypothetical protein FDP41_010136 [Naegleria fowleri]